MISRVEFSKHAFFNSLLRVAFSTLCRANLAALPCKLRGQCPGAIYHVMNRGDRREPIFKDEADHLRFLEPLGEACAKTGWQVRAYCLMDNHFHLVVETLQANLVAGTS